MIDEYNDDRTGWARFSDDMTMRYRLARCIDGTNRVVVNDPGITEATRRCTFLMLNPSTADAFQNDPTVGECIKRARRASCDVLEVVNLFALRSPYPADLKKRAHGFRGDDAINNGQILMACVDTSLIVAAWGNHGALDHRAAVVRELLRDHGIKLHHLGTTQDGYPKHPLARGKHRIPADLQLTEWTV